MELSEMAFWDLSLKIILLILIFNKEIFTVILFLGLRNLVHIYKNICIKCSTIIIVLNNLLYSRT